ncbi:MAG: NifU family protein [Cyclobacteriaceae bacterium]|nr:NifU family protein [Cyclobacteriaceae bacterium]
MITKDRPVHIYLEANPNPNSLKFVLNFMIVPEAEAFDFPDLESAEHAPLAKKLFALSFVKRVFYMSNFVTVTKDETSEWTEIQDEIRNVIKDHLENGEPVLDTMAQKAPSGENDTELDIRIKSILDEYIKPAVEQDGGAIQYHSFNEGVVKVLLQGSCSGCPSSTVTLKAGIENLLKAMIPEVKSVEAEGI